MNDLSLNSVSLSFGKKQVLKNINLTIEKGAKLALFGFNGAGKTSLIHTVLGLLNYEGQIFIQGEEARSKKARQSIFYLPEKFRPHSLLKGKDYLNLFPSFRKSQQNDDIYLNQKIGFYSKGMAQQLGIELIKNNTSPILILDEPTSGLDFLRRKELKNLLQGINRTLIITGHNPHFLQKITDYLLILYQGKTLFYGPFPKLKGENLENWIIELISKD